MSRPQPTYVYHFTHIVHLERIASAGLFSDTLAQQLGLIAHEAGNREIKEKRRRRAVAVGAGGVVADYVPFYYAPRSPMMYTIRGGNVASFTGSIYDLVYLRTTVEALIDSGKTPVFTDRNACLSICAFSCDLDDLDRMVDWPLMNARWWNNIPEDPQRMERRQAECLVHQFVPWSAFTEVGVYSDAHAQVIGSTLGSQGTIPPVLVRPDWYY
ncbi:type II toxin-antitoxin system toxin DNA ADP-ribosyl transferase DarT [Nocardia beijingensis]